MMPLRCLLLVEYTKRMWMTLQVRSLQQEKKASMISNAGERMVLVTSRSIQRFSIYRNGSWPITGHVVRRVNCFQYSKRHGDFEKLLIVLSCSV
jgi:hypothetical protein